MDKDKDGKPLPEPLLTTIDGQHTVQVRFLKGDHIALCNIHFGLTYNDTTGITYQQAAEAFLTLNKNRRVNVWSAFNAGLEAGILMYEQIKEVCDQMGYTLPCHTEDSDLRNETVLTDLFVKRDRGGLPMLKRFLTIIKPWRHQGRLVKAAQGNAFQRGLSDFLVKHGARLTDADIIKVFKQYDPCQLQTDAKNLTPRGNRGVDKKQICYALEVKFGFATKAKAA